MKTKSKIGLKQLLQIGLIYLFAFLALAACTKSIAAKTLPAQAQQSIHEKFVCSPTAEENRSAKCSD